MAALAAATTIAVALITQNRGQISPWWLIPTAALALAAGVLVASAASRSKISLLSEHLAEAQNDLRKTKDEKDDAVERLRGVQRRLEARARRPESRAT